jgi:hypothetical protein
MALDFPNSPTNGQQFTGGAGTWQWDGTKWVAVSAPGGPYLPLTGGSLGGPGNLTVGGLLTASGTVLGTTPGNSGQFRMAPNASGTSYGSFWRNDGSNTYLLLTANNDALGTWNALRPFMVNNANGLVTLSNGLAVAGAPAQSTITSVFGATTWNFAVNSGDDGAAGSISYRTFDTTALNIVGAGTASGNRAVHIYDNLYVSSNVQVYGGLIYFASSGAYISADSTNFSFKLGSGNGAWYFLDSGSTQKIIINKSGINYSYLGSGTNQIGWNWNGSAIGIYVDGGYVGQISGLSDRRVKRNIEPSRKDALATLRDIPLFAFDRIAHGTGRDDIVHHADVGFIAQELEPLIPEAVHRGMRAEDDLLSIDLLPVCAYLLRAVQQLADEVEELKNGR